MIFNILGLYMGNTVGLDLYEEPIDFNEGVTDITAVTLLKTKKQIATSTLTKLSQEYGGTQWKC